MRGAQRAERRAQKEAAGGRRAGPSGRPRRTASPTARRGALDRLQDDVAGEAVGDDHVGVGIEQVAALDVAAEVAASPTSRRAPRAPRRRSPFPSSPPRRPRAGRRAARSTPRTASANAAPRWANWTRWEGRASELAPTSSISSGRSRPGAGSWTASAGRWTPRIRFRANSAAAIVAPVEPGLASASERPSATSAAAQHDRRARAARGRRAPGSSSLPIASVGLDQLDAVERPERLELARTAEDPNRDPVGRPPCPTPSITASGRPRRRARRRRRSPLPRRAGGRARHLLLLGACRRSRAWAGRARRPHDPRRCRRSGRRDAASAGCGTAGHSFSRGAGDRVVGAALVAAGAGLSLLRDCHEARDRSWTRSAAARELGHRIAELARASRSADRAGARGMCSPGSTVVQVRRRRRRQRPAQSGRQSSCSGRSRVSASWSQARRRARPR